jgi:hypothetical protein
MLNVERYYAQGREEADGEEADGEEADGVSAHGEEAVEQRSTAQKPYRQRCVVLLVDWRYRRVGGRCVSRQTSSSLGGRSH